MDMILNITVTLLPKITWKVFLGIYCHGSSSNRIIIIMERVKNPKEHLPKLGGGAGKNETNFKLTGKWYTWGGGGGGPALDIYINNIQRDQMNQFFKMSNPENGQKVLKTITKEYKRPPRESNDTSISLKSEEMQTKPGGLLKFSRLVKINFKILGCMLLVKKFHL